MMRSRFSAMVRPPNSPGFPVSFRSTNMPNCRPQQVQGFIRPCAVELLFRLGCDHNADQLLRYPFGGQHGAMS